MPSLSNRLVPNDYVYKMFGTEMKSKANPMQGGPPFVPYNGPPLTFAQKYDMGLKDLTFNSKPIINGLTVLAGQYKMNADEVANLIRARVLQVRAASTGTVL